MAHARIRGTPHAFLRSGNLRGAAAWRGRRPIDDHATKGSTDDKRHDDGNAGKVAISEGAEVYGSDGKQWGRVEAVGAKYLTIAEGLLGQRAYYLPIGVVAAADDERVELKVPLVDAKAQALTEEPADEPIFGESAPIPPEAMEAVGIPSRSARRWASARTRRRPSGCAARRGWSRFPGFPPMLPRRGCRSMVYVGAWGDALAFTAGVLIGSV